MKLQKATLLFFLTFILYQSNAQDSKDNNYIEFNDRKNIVHGVYLGISGGYGQIKGKSTYITGLKLAYVANRKFEIGLVIKGLYSNQNLSSIFLSDGTELGPDLAAVYGGFHLEPIFFSEAKVNLSFPLLIGAGAAGAGYFELNLTEEEEAKERNSLFSSLYVVEPGVNVLYNISRYVQLEAGIKYRFSGKAVLTPNAFVRINGFSTSLGIKIGVFNLGRNRYKKNISDDK
ncbi:hypothetical protein [Aquimarina sp. 2304DJ70-9]|uniref:hypothetical protein n=1 Tax=Aquimarina penaris TaxID=3231044 RepID=UPI00346219AE